MLLDFVCRQIGVVSPQAVADDRGCRFRLSFRAHDNIEQRKEPELRRRKVDDTFRRLTEMPHPDVGDDAHHSPLLPFSSRNGRPIGLSSP